MVTIEKDSTVQNEQVSTSETNVEVSKKRQETEEALNNSKKDEEILGVNHQTTISSRALANEIINQDTPKSLSDEEIAKIVDNATLKMVANKWITKCEDLLDGLKGDKKSKRELKEKVGRSIKDMKKMIDDEHLYETVQNEYKDRLGQIIYLYYDNREPARQTIMMGGRVPLIKGIPDTKKEIKRNNTCAKENTEYQIDVSELKQNTALYNRIGVSADEWGEYCDFIGQGGVSITHPVFVQHTVGFNNVKAYDPDLYRMITPEGQITYNTYCQRNPEMYQAYCQNNNIVCHPRSFAETAGVGLSEMVSKIFPGIDSDPRKKQARQKAGSLLAIGGAAVMGFKFFKNLFSKKADNNGKWRKAAGRGAGLLALLNIRGVENRLENISGWHPAEKTRMLAETFSKYSFSDAQAMEIADMYVSAPITTMSALHFIPIYELERQHILEDKNGDFEFNYDNYKKYVDEYAWDNNQKEQVLKAGQQLRDKKCVGAGLRAFGIATRDKLRDLFGSDKNKTLAQTKKVQDGWENMVERVRSGVNKELYNHGLRAKNPEVVETIMSEYGDGQKSKEEVNKLILDWMKRGLLELTTEKEYTVNDMVNGPYKDLMDLENMTMKGFKYSESGNEVKFGSYKELFEAVYITEKIKYIFQSREDAVDGAPFHINILGEIAFNNTKWYEIHQTDTAVISLKKLNIDLPTIKNNRKAYNKYLNDWRLGSL